MFITISDRKEIQLPITSKNGLSILMNLQMLSVSKVNIGEENTSMAKFLATKQGILENKVATNKECILVVGWR